MPNKLDISDYPPFYRAADDAAASFQRKYLWALRVQLCMLVLAAVASSWSPEKESTRELAGCVVAGLMFLALVSQWAVRERKYDDRWFQCRAFAENAKTATWRYMMLPRISDDDFVRELAEIRSRYPEAAKSLAVFLGEGSQVTSRMLALRRAPVIERAKFYLERRLGDQARWYREGSRANGRREGSFFWAVVVVEVAGMFLAVLAGPRGWEMNPTGMVAAAATALLAWAQTKRYSDLATSYGSTAQDLSLLEPRTPLASEGALEEFVGAVENVVSREHRMWLTKRGLAVV